MASLHVGGDIRSLARSLRSYERPLSEAGAVFVVKCTTDNKPRFPRAGSPFCAFAPRVHGIGMKALRLPVLFASLASTLFAAEPASLAPAEAAKLVADGKAVLVDVREPAEWAESGVAGPAVLLAKSEFDAGLKGDWKSYLAKTGGKEIILYCRSGHRAGVVAAALTAMGFKTANAGGFKDWQAAGLPTRQVEPVQH